MEIVREKAYAKINLYLDVNSKLDNGYHDLMTIMQTVSLHDDVEIKFNRTGKINITCDNEILNDDPENNLAYKAAKVFYKNLGFQMTFGVDIHIKKRIPLLAGLGGGSADAAAVLRGMNLLYGRTFRTADLYEMAHEIGADVPFCVVGGAQICGGIGGPAMCYSGIKNYNLLIAIGGEKESTAEQFRRLDRMHNDFKGYARSMGPGEVFRMQNSSEVGKSFSISKNIFEKLYDEESNVGKIKNIMMENGAYHAMLSGSGPAVFGVFPNFMCVEDAEEALRKENITTYPCMPISMPYDQLPTTLFEEN